MNRRDFLRTILVVPFTLSVSKWAVASNSDDLKSFGFYQGLGPKEARDPRRTDGTYYNMPLILRDDIEAAVEKSYAFWHGHDGKAHSFTLTEAHFLDLQDGKTIDVYTNVVTGHRHSLRIVG